MEFLTCSKALPAANIAKELAKGAESNLYFETKEDALSKLPAIIQKGDVVLVKASHSMEFEKIVDELKKLK